MANKNSHRTEQEYSAALQTKGIHGDEFYNDIADIFQKKAVLKLFENVSWL